jgi:DNA polymerase III delta prime subunit
MLGKMIASDTLPASLLFTGPAGAGKELAALRLAALLECAEGTACGSCPACGAISTLEHPDVHLVYPVPSADWQKSLPVIIESRREDFLSRGEFGNRARSIGIEQIRTVMEKISRQPFSGLRSLVAVMEAHRATTEAQNAFLKVLEEPPPSSVIVLVTERTDLLLPTVLSRCSEVRFDPLPDPVTADFLSTFLSVEEGEARRLSKLAGGDLQRASRLLDERFLGLRKDAANLVGLVLEGKARRLPVEAESAAHSYTREEAGDLLDEMSAVLRNLLRGDRGELPPETAEKASDRDISADMGKISAASRSLRRNADIELTLSQLLLDLAGRWY